MRDISFITRALLYYRNQVGAPKKNRRKNKAHSFCTSDPCHALPSSKKISQNKSRDRQRYDDRQIKRKREAEGERDLFVNANRSRSPKGGHWQTGRSLIQEVMDSSEIFEALCAV